MRYTDNTNGERKTPAIPESIREIMTAGLDMKLHLVQHHAHMAYLLAGELLNDELVYLIQLLQTGETEGERKNA